MKKVLSLTNSIIALVCLISMTNCAGTVSKDGNTVSMNEVVVDYTDEYISSSGFISHEHEDHVLNVRHFTYQGHSYIQFDVAAAYGGKTGIVHDPECLKRDLRYDLK